MKELCKLGCGKDINLEEIIFSDKVRIRIPKDGDQLHICKNVTHYSYGNTNSTTRHSWTGMKSHKLVDYEGTIIDNFFADPMQSYDYQNYHDRQLMRKVIGYMLYESPYFFSFPLSYMDIDMGFISFENDHSAPLQLLGSLYELDGMKVDAIKCYEIMNELPKGKSDLFGDRINYLRKRFDKLEMFEPIVEITHRGNRVVNEFDMKNYASYIQKFFGDEIHVVETKEIFPENKENQNIREKLENFEKFNLRGFIRKNFSPEEIHDYMVKQKWRFNSEANLLDKAKNNRREELEGTVENLGPDDDIEFLDMKDNVLMIKHFFEKYHSYERNGKKLIPGNYYQMFVNMKRINKFRNTISHSKNYNSEQFENERNVIAPMIVQVIAFFEKYKKD